MTNASSAPKKSVKSPKSAKTSEKSETPPKPKQAVVVIHGMGEQRPMETIRAFVNQVWKQDKNLVKPRFWNKPSSVSESFEQRRLTTDTPNLSGSQTQVKRTDFYEYYWAHHTVGTKWEHLVGWVKTLLLCWPSKYNNHPTTLKPFWFVLWTLITLGGLLLALWYFAINSNDVCFYTIAFILSIAWTWGAATVRKFFTQYFGDVARYVQAKPANIGIRQAVRKGGIDLLERIHQSGDYDRIVLVGHSLGSIVAYDILTHLWARHNKFKSALDNVPLPLTSNAKDIADELAALAKRCGKDDFEQALYREKQQTLFEELRRTDPDRNWLISDFITLGSPLTYADILLLEDKNSFIKRKLDRELPTSPPVTENDCFYYSHDGNHFLHHGAVFAPVKWTNIYMPHERFWKGDLISGLVSPNFSYESFDNNSGKMTPPLNFNKTPICEIEQAYMDVKDGFTHTEYWKAGLTDDHLLKLRQAVSLY